MTEPGGLTFHLLYLLNLLRVSCCCEATPIRVVHPVLLKCLVRISPLAATAYAWAHHRGSCDLCCLWLWLVVAMQGVDISKAFMKHLRSTLSRYLFTAMLHELYSQRLKQHLNLIIIPLIFLNAFSAVLSSGSLASIQNLSDGLRQGAYSL